MNRAFLSPPLPLFRWLTGLAAIPIMLVTVLAWRSNRDSQLQREYFWHYIESQFTKSDKPYAREFICYTRNGHEVPATGELDPLQHPHWSKLLIRDYSRWLQNAIYGGEELRYLIRWPMIWGGGLAMVLFGLGFWLDRVRRLRFRSGRHVRGPRIVSRAEFRRKVRGDGLGWLTEDRRTVGEWISSCFIGVLRCLRGEWQGAWWEVMTGTTVRRLRMEQPLENHHLSVMGAPGSGKTSLLLQLADEALNRGLAVIFHDPHRQYMERYYQPDTDVVLNPADARCPHWSPAGEIDYSDLTLATAQANSFAESLYPGNPHRRDWFFTDACRRIVRYVLTWYKPNAAQMAEMLTHPDPILEAIAVGTELEEMLNKNADSQYAGITGTLTQVAEAFRMVPPDDGRPVWSAREWCQHRKGKIFITNTAKTRTGLRPLQTLWIDIIIREVLSMGERPDLPGVLMIIDEMASLLEIGQLASAFREMRKAGLMIAVGFHDRGSLKAIYGEEVESIFGGPATKVILRVGEPEGADWGSKILGEVDTERLREHRGTNGERTYTSEIARNERAVMASELSGLEPRVGYLRYGDYIVPMKIALAERKGKIAEGLIQRTSEAVETKPMPNLEELRAKKKAEQDKLMSGVIFKSPAERQAEEDLGPDPEAITAGAVVEERKAPAPSRRRPKRGPDGRQDELWQQ